MDVPAVGALFEEDAQACGRIGTQRLVVFRGFARAFGVAAGQLVGEATGRVVVAADETTGLAEFQRQSAIAAGWAFAGIEIQRCAIFLVAGEEVLAQRIIERVDHLGNSQLLGFLDQLVEVGPECAQHLFPRQPAAGNIVKLLFEICREIVLNIALEEVR